jgi:amidase
MVRQAVFPYTEYDGLGLAELIRTKQVTAEEVLEEAIRQMELQNPQLNAVINNMAERARREVRQLESNGVFAGVPILLKDITQEIEGEPLTQGSKAFQRYRAAQDSAFVKRIRQTGVSIIGQTNVPEFALLAVTEPDFHGPTRNPWNVAHTPGGSSGGSAAAVAAGIVPVAGANDGGGSIRIPAAYCGLFGLKPTRGRTPVGTHGRLWQGASVEHVLTRTVRDSAAMLDQLKTYERAAAFHAPPYHDAYLTCVTTPLKVPLRIAFTLRSPLGTDVHPECEKAALKTVKLLEEMGHHVEEKEAPVDGLKLANSYLTMYYGEVAATLASLEDVLQRQVKFRDVEATTWLLGLLGRAIPMQEFVLSIREWDRAALQMETFHETYDLYLTPTTAFPPARIGELAPNPLQKVLMNIVGPLRMGRLLRWSGTVDEVARQNLTRTPFTQLANLTGQPAMSLPMHVTDDGLPCGVQCIAARGREDLLLQIAGELERTDAWEGGREVSNREQNGVIETEA